MKKFSIRIKQEALDDLEIIFEFARTQYSLEVAVNQDEHLIAKIHSLEYFPLRNRTRGDLDGNEIYQLNAGSYRIFYIVIDYFVVVQRVVHMKQDFEY